MGLVVIVGGLASGKTTLAKYLEQNHNYKRIVTYTTRPARLGEIEGVDYRFISDTTFQDLSRSGFFFETMQYQTAEGVWWYGTSRESLEKKGKNVVVLSPKAAITLKDSALIVWLDTPLKLRMERALARGDNPLEIARRVIADKNDFASYEIVNVRGWRIQEPFSLKIFADDIDRAAIRIDSWKAFFKWKEEVKQ